MYVQRTMSDIVSIVAQKMQQVAKRHLAVSSSLALLLSCCEVSDGSRVAAPTGGQSPVEWGEILSIHLSVHLSYIQGV